MGEPAVPDWTVHDVDRMVAVASVVAFDLDNTLARSKKPMHADMADALSRLTQRIPVAIVTGGSFQLVSTQVLNVLTDEAARERLHIMPTSGTRYYRWDGEQWQCLYAHDLSEGERRAAMHSLETRARQEGIWAQRVWGDRIEDRGGQITFSALGQHAPLEQKEAWDPANEKKNRLVRAVSRDLPGLAVRSGGSTSVDISQRGIDKAYAVRQLADVLHIDIGEIMFVGDRMDPAGNDYPAVCAGVMPIHVSCPADTLRVCLRMLDILPVRGTGGSL